MTAPKPDPEPVAPPVDEKEETFLVGNDGKILTAYHKVKAKAHPDEVLVDAKELL